MKLKYMNPTCEIVLRSTLNHAELIFSKIVKIAIRNESYKLFFQEDALIAQNTRLSITISFQIQMEWIKAFYIDKNIICKKKNSNSNFEKKKFAPHPLFLAYLGITFVPGHWLKKNYMPMKIINFSNFQKKFKKSGQKISP